MNVSPISFGKRIPVVKCNLLNEKTKKPVSATVYELNCHDQSDIDEIRNLACSSYSWRYAPFILPGMETKRVYEGIFGHNYDRRYYILETDKEKEITGICEVERKKDAVNIQHLESKQNKKYKYAGFALISGLANNMIESDAQILGAEGVVDSAKKFYTEKCGFVKSPDEFLCRYYYMDKPAIEKFMNKMSAVIQSKPASLNPYSS